MTLLLELTIPGKPVPKGRPRVTRSGTTYTPARTKRFERAVGLIARSKGPEFQADGPLRLEVTCVYGRPGSNAPKVSGRVPCDRGGSHYPDADNVLKAVADGLEGIAYANDKQLAQVEASKVFGAEGEQSCTEVRLWRLE